MEDVAYKPNMDVVRSARYFIKSLCETYGHDRGMAVWDQIRAVLGDQAASDIFLGMLTQEYHTVSITRIGPYKIEAIKLVRHITGYGLKEAKDFVEDVSDRGQVKTLDLSSLAPEQVNAWIQDMRRVGCEIQ